MLKSTLSVNNAFSNAPANTKYFQNILKIIEKKNVRNIHNIEKCSMTIGKTLVK